MLHYNQYGENSPVIVLIHGFCENNTCFNKQVLLLKEHCKLILPDLPGAGKSPVIPGLTMEKMADEIKALLNALGVEKCFMFGHSMGGYATLAFAKKYTAHLNGFGLMHSTAYADDETRKEKRLQAIKLIEQKGAAFYAKNFIPPLFKSNFPSHEYQYLIDAAEEFTSEGLVGSLMVMRERPDSRDWLRETNLPVFFAIGYEDELIPKSIMMEQALRVQQSYVALLQNSAHMGHIEESEHLAKHLLKFIQNTHY